MEPPVRPSVSFHSNDLGSSTISCRSIEPSNNDSDAQNQAKKHLVKRVLAIKNLKNGRTVSSTNNQVPPAHAIVSPKISSTTLLDKCSNATFETKDVIEEEERPNTK